MITCDVCGKNVTSDSETLENDGMPEYENINLNGKICLCHDCFLALSDFVRSEEFKKVAKREIGE